MVSKTRREDGPSKGRAVRTCGDRDGQKNGSDVSFLSSGVRQDREGKGREKGKGQWGNEWVGGWIERWIRTRGDMLGYLVADHDCPDGEAVCQWLCHRDNVWVGVDRVGGVGPHCSRPEETALPDKVRTDCTKMGWEVRGTGEWGNSGVDFTWISSKMRTAPTRSHSARNSLRKSTEASLTPPSPWMGSMKTAQVSSVMAFFAASESPNWTRSKPGTKGVNGSWYLRFGVALKAPMVLPWNAFVKYTMRVFGECSHEDAGPSRAFAQVSFAYLRENLMAPSFASVPVLEKKTFAPPPPLLSSFGRSARPPSARVVSTNSLASSPAHSLYQTLLVCTILAACSPAKLASSSSACPRALTAMPAEKSRYLRSWISYTQEPLPWDKTRGGRA